MANKKFSQFTLGTTNTDIEYVVGYKSTDNIQIDPSALDSKYEVTSFPITGGVTIELEGTSGPATGYLGNFSIVEGENIDVSFDSVTETVSIANTQKNTFIVNGTFKNLFGGSPGIFGDTLEFGQASVPSTDHSSVFVAPFNCKIVSIALKWISDDAVSINAGSSWQVKIFKMTSPTGSTTVSGNYASGVNIPGIVLDTNDTGGFPIKTATGLSGSDFELSLGDIINISGIESGTIAQSDAEIEVFIGIEAV